MQKHTAEICSWLQNYTAMFLLKYTAENFSCLQKYTAEIEVYSWELFLSTEVYSWDMFLSSIVFKNYRKTIAKMYILFFTLNSFRQMVYHVILFSWPHHIPNHTVPIHFWYYVLRSNLNVQVPLSRHQGRRDNDLTSQIKGCPSAMHPIITV